LTRAFSISLCGAWVDIGFYRFAWAGVELTRAFSISLCGAGSAAFPWADAIDNGVMRDVGNELKFRWA
jgi:hypothetical protein